MCPAEPLNSDDTPQTANKEYSVIKKMILITIVFSIGVLLYFVPGVLINFESILLILIIIWWSIYMLRVFSPNIKLEYVVDGWLDVINYYGEFFKRFSGPVILLGLYFFKENIIHLQFGDDTMNILFWFTFFPMLFISKYILNHFFIFFQRVYHLSADATKSVFYDNYNKMLEGSKLYFGKNFILIKRDRISVRVKFGWKDEIYLDVITRSGGEDLNRRLRETVDAVLEGRPPPEAEASAALGDGQARDAAPSKAAEAAAPEGHAAEEAPEGQ